MRIHLYNEDGYTLWMLAERLPELLSALGDPTPPNSESIQIFYRPSFGRAERRQFGEPDLLIGTPHQVYHIESKPRLTSTRKRMLQLKDSQILRHRIFQTYRMLWQKYRPSTWTDFHAAAVKEFEQAHPNRTMPLSRHLLSQNLEFVLRTFQKCGPEVCDAILLFERPAKKSKPPTVYTNPHGFRSVVMPLEMISGSNFVSVHLNPAS